MAGRIIRARLFGVAAARTVIATPPCIHATRSIHVSPSLLARQSRRGGRVTKPAATLNPYAELEDVEDGLDDADVKKATFYTKEELDENPELLEAALANEDGNEESDPETNEFLKEIDELFTLDAKDFGRRLNRIDNGERPMGPTTFDAEAVDAMETEEEVDDEIDRAERIPKKRLLRVLDEFDAHKPRMGKNAESMAVPKTKAMAPLEKKIKKADPERISHRQEKVEISVTGFVQNLLLEDADMMDNDVFANIVEASVSPDLRRAVLYWEPARRNSTNQVIAKRKTEGVELRLKKLEKWVRMSVTRHLNLKYSPVIQFKRRKENKSDEARKVFDHEMAWLERFK